MIYLVLAVCCSTSIAVLMRLSGKIVKNNMVMFMANYFACIILSRIFVGKLAVFSGGEGFLFCLGLGTCTGVLYLVTFVLLEFNQKRNGMVMTNLMQKLGVLVPTVMAIAFFDEVPKPVQLAGFAVALAAVITLNYSKEKSSVKNMSMGFLFIHLFLSGLSDSFSNVFDKLGNPELKNVFLFYIFFTAFILSIVMIFVRKQKFRALDALWGLLIGIPNYFSARFLLLSLSTLPAIVAYPVYNVSNLLCISTIGVLAFKEKLEKKKIIGLLLIVIAVVLFNS